MSVFRIALPLRCRCSWLLVSIGLGLLLVAGGARAASLEQAEALLAAGHPAQADHAVAEFLAEQPNSARAHYVDARILAAEHKWPLAEQELERARRLDPALGFAPAAQVQALADEVIRHRWKNPSGLAGYGQAALAAVFVLVSGYLFWGILRAKRRPPRA